jgi:hypothetical protein
VIRAGRLITPELAVAIFTASGLRKQIAFAYRVSQSAVSGIKNGRMHGDVTRPYAEAAIVNAMLVTTACGVVP